MRAVVKRLQGTPVERGFLAAVPRVADAIAPCARQYRSLRRHGARSGSALVLTPADPGSLGDEAMLVVLTQSLLGLGFDRIGYVSLRAGWSEIIGRGCATRAKLVSHALGSALEYWQTPFRFLQLLANYSHLMVVGADVMDGAYSAANSCRRVEMAALGHRAGLQVRVLGFSFNAQPAESVLASLRRLPPEVRLMARDPVSAHRLEVQLARPVGRVADIAFLLKPSLTSSSASRASGWLQSERGRGQVCLGVNANRLVAHPIDAEGPNALVTAISTALERLLTTRHDVSVLLLPHDLRGRVWDDEAMVLSIASSLPPALKERVRVLETPFGAADVKHLCGQLDIVLTGRMHMAIAALGQNTPALGMAYQGKFEGLYELFGLQECRVDPNDALNSALLAERLGVLIDRRDEYRQRIGERLPDVIQRARDNFAGMSISREEHGRSTGVARGPGESS